MTAAPKPDVFRDAKYLAWLRYQRCVVCEHLGAMQRTSSDPAHTPRVRIHGDEAVPLCRHHHLAEERLQPTAFWAQYALDPAALFRAYYALYLAQCADIAW